MFDNQIIEGEFIKLDNVYLSSFNYKKIENASIDELKKYCIDDKYCLGFTNDGMIKFFIDKEKIESNNENKTLYIHKERFEKLINKEEEKEQLIPKIIHFIWFHKGRAFNIVNYIAIKAALFHNPEYKVYLHCTQEPINNIYFNDIKDKIFINIVEEPYFINNRQVPFFQHKADYVRLNILKDMGGIYFDTDYILLKNLDSFLNNKFVIGKERPNSDDYYCNCVIMCIPNSDIVKEWLHIYENSWGENFIASWMGHSVMIPVQLSKKHEMTICDNNVFYPFLWNDLSILHDKDNMQTYDDSIGVHLWDTEACKTNLLPLNVRYFKNKKNAFVRLFKKYVEDLEDLEDEINDKFIEENFLVFKGKDHFGDDIQFCYNTSLYDLIDICINTPNCVGFNTIGFIKSKIDLENLHNLSDNGYSNCTSKESLYVYKKRL